MESFRFCPERSPSRHTFFSRDACDSERTQDCNLSLYDAIDIARIDSACCCKPVWIFILKPAHYPFILFNLRRGAKVCCSEV